MSNDCTNLIRIGGPVDLVRELTLALSIDNSINIAPASDNSEDALGAYLHAKSQVGADPTAPVFVHGQVAVAADGRFPGFRLGPRDSGGASGALLTLSSVVPQPIGIANWNGFNLGMWGAKWEPNSSHIDIEAPDISKSVQDAAVSYIESWPESDASATPRSHQEIRDLVLAADGNLHHEIFQQFGTPNSPVTKWAATVAQRFPGVVIEIVAEEGGNDVFSCNVFYRAHGADQAVDRMIYSVEDMVPSSYDITVSSKNFNGNEDSYDEDNQADQDAWIHRAASRDMLIRTSLEIFRATCLESEVAHVLCRERKRVPAESVVRTFRDLGLDGFRTYVSGVSEDGSGTQSGVALSSFSEDVRGPATRDACGHEKRSRLDRLISMNPRTASGYGVVDALVAHVSRHLEGSYATELHVDLVGSHNGYLGGGGVIVESGASPIRSLCEELASEKESGGNALARLLGSDCGVLVNGRHVLSLMPQVAVTARSAIGLRHVLEHATMTPLKRTEDVGVVFDGPSAPELPGVLKSGAESDPEVRNVSQVIGGSATSSFFMDIALGPNGFVYVGPKFSRSREAENNRVRSLMLLLDGSGPAAVDAWEFAVRQGLPRDVVNRSACADPERIRRFLEANPLDLVEKVVAENFSTLRRTPRSTRRASAGKSGPVVTPEDLIDDIMHEARTRSIFERAVSAAKASATASMASESVAVNSGTDTQAAKVIKDSARERRAPKI